MPLKILFISRAYPPVVGGIENQNAALSTWLSKEASVTTIANRFGKKFLPLFVPYALIRTLLSAHRFDAILLGDGVLALVGWAVKKAYPEKAVLSVIHGLDLTYPLGIYQRFWVRRFIPGLDRLIAVGNETIQRGKERGIPHDRFVFVPNGIDAEAHSHPEFGRKDLETILGESVSGINVLLTSGRLARRKGVAWFIRNVLPVLPENTIYVVAGDGADRDNIQNAVKETGLFARVKILGYVNNRTRDILMNTADIFVQPNIAVPNDMEGFGISVIEAASSGIPVVASRLEGLKDAISDAVTGFLVEPGNAAEWKVVVEQLLSHPEKRRAFGERAKISVAARFDWSIIVQSYIRIIRETVAHVGRREPVAASAIAREKISE